MIFVKLLLLSIAWLAILFILFGLYKPWVMLWWEDVQNRKKVLKLYGSIAIISWLLYWLISFY